MTFVSTLGQALDQAERLKTLQSQLGNLQMQLTTGKKADLFKGLESNVITSKRARANVNALDNYINNIAIADRRIKMTTSLVAEIRTQSEGLLGSMEIQTQQGEYEIESLGNYASNLQGFIVNLLNEKDGDRYLMSGADTLVRPLTDTGSLDTYITQQINDWVNGTLTTDQFMQTYKDSVALNDTIIGYSAELSSGQTKSVSVRVDDNAEIDYTVKANAAPFRDILIAISLMKNLNEIIDEVTLDPADNPGTTVTAPGATQEEQNENFYRVFNDIAATLSSALDRIDTERFKLSQAQAQMSQIGQNHKTDKNTFLSMISDVENVDINEVAVKLNTLTVQLEASYRVTATVSSFNLARFLSA